MKPIRVDEATEVVQRSLTKWPRDPVLLNLKGVLLKRRGRLSEAIQAFKQACNADPRQAGAVFNLANSYLAIGDATKAAVTFVKVIAREPKNSEAHRLYGQALQQLGDVEKAETSLRAALSVNPQNISAALGLASLLDDLCRYSEGIGILDEAIAKNGETAELARAKTILLRHWGRIDQSINYLVDLIRRQPNAAWAHHLLGRELTTDREKANVCLRRAYELDPSNPLYLADLADNCNRSRYGDEGAHIQSAYEFARKFLEQGHEIQAHSKALRDIFLRCGDFATVETIGSFDELGKFWALKGDAVCPSSSSRTGDLTRAAPPAHPTSPTLGRVDRTKGRSISAETCESSCWDACKVSRGLHVLRSAQSSGFLFRFALARRLRSLTIRILLLFLLYRTTKTRCKSEYDSASTCSGLHRVFRLGKQLKS